MCDYPVFRGGKWGQQIKVVNPNLHYVILLNSQVHLVTFFCFLSASSSSGTWWSGTIRSTSPGLSSWRKIQPSRSTGAGSVSSTARTAPAYNTSATLWTSDLPELQEGGSAEKMSGQGWHQSEVLEEGGQDWFLNKFMDERRPDLFVWLGLGALLKAWTLR